MRNVLFSRRTGALPLNGLHLPAFVGTNGFRATAKRQKRFEFVRDPVLLTVTRIPAHLIHAIEWGRDSATSPASSRRYSETRRHHE